MREEIKMRRYVIASTAFLLICVHSTAAQDPSVPLPVQLCEDACSASEGECRAICMPTDESASLESEVQEAIEECALGCIAPSVACFEICRVESEMAATP